MILNLNNLLAQIQRMIFDPDALVWSVEQITDFIRLGLEDLQTISPVKCSLEGLDDAQTTSLESGMLAYLVRSIIARAYETRLLNRSETFHPDAQNGSTNRIWLDAEKEQLRQNSRKNASHFPAAQPGSPLPDLGRSASSDGVLCGRRAIMHSIYLKINQDVFPLHGEGITPPLRGCSRQASQPLSNGHCLERLILVIQGTPAQGRQILARLQSFLERIRLGQEATIHLQVEPRSDFYHSRLYRGDFTWVADSVQVKGFGVQLELERDDFWEGATHSLPLSNRHGTQVSGGLLVDNRADGNGENQVTWASARGAGRTACPRPIVHHPRPGPDSQFQEYLRRYAARN